MRQLNYRHIFYILQCSEILSVSAQIFVILSIQFCSNIAALTVGGAP